MVGTRRKELSLNAIYEMDCVRGLDLIRPGSVDLAFADPPFNIGYTYDVYEDSRQSHEYLDWSRRWVQGLFRALKPTGTFWLAIGDEYAAELKVIAQNEVGFHCRSWVIWYYTFGMNCVRNFSRSHTHLLYFVKDAEQFTFNAENPAIRVPSARELVYADRRANPKGRLPDNTWILRPQDAPRGFSEAQDTWYFARVAGTFKEREGFHGCQMPEQLLGRIIRCCSNPMEAVLDPFAGSGTTLAVAKKLGRQWIGFELSSNYVRRIRKRLAAAAPGQPLDGPADPLASAPPTAAGKRRPRPFTRQGRGRGGRAHHAAADDLRRGIVAAYLEARAGCSVDQLLADPELNDAFLEACRRRGLPGHPVDWNRALVTVRKQGQLPHLNGQKRRSLNFLQMDAYCFASEIAMQLLRVEFDRTLDELLCNPELAREFDRLAGSFVPGYTPFQYRWAALSIRKKAKVWKERAVKHYAAWLHRELPPPVPLSRGEWKTCEGPGVYLLTSRNRWVLYVGQTFSLCGRIEQIVATPAWRELELTSVRLLPHQEIPYGLQSALVGRVRPPLNSELLLPAIPETNAAS